MSAPDSSSDPPLEEPAHRKCGGAGPILLDAAGAAALLSMARSTFLGNDSRGLVPRAARIGRLRRWSRQELRDWVAAGCPPRVRWEALRR